MTAADEFVPEGGESATIYVLTPDCPLCGGVLGPSWDAITPRLCLCCGARIRMAVIDRG